MRKANTVRLGVQASYASTARSGTGGLQRLDLTRKLRASATAQQVYTSAPSWAFATGLKVIRIVKANIVVRRGEMYGLPRWDRRSGFAVLHATTPDEAPTWRIDDGKVPECSTTVGEASITSQCDQNHEWSRYHGNGRKRFLGLFVP